MANNDEQALLSWHALTGLGFAKFLILAVIQN